MFGSNDYFAPTLRNPLRYLLPDDGQRNTAHAAAAVARPARRASTDAGWLDLTNRRGALDGARARTFAFAGRRRPAPGVRRPRPPSPGPADADADLRLGVAHAPYLRVLDQFAADGYDAILAGHTHGGQVCLPVIGALVTNCDLDTGPRQGPAPAPGGLRDPATRGRRGCTSRPGWAPRRTPRSGSAAAPRRPC